MKLVMAIVSKEDTSSVTHALTKENYYITRLSTTGGFLRAGNTTLLIGTDDEKVDHCIELIGAHSKHHTQKAASSAPDGSREVKAGGATVFVLGVSILFNQYDFEDHR